MPYSIIHINNSSYSEWYHFGNPTLTLDDIRRSRKIIFDGGFFVIYDIDIDNSNDKILAIER